MVVLLGREEVEAEEETVKEEEVASEEAAVPEVAETRPPLRLPPSDTVSTP